jgi:hypothetical protein
VHDVDCSESIEAQCKDYDERLKSKNALVELAEWEVWARLRDRADRLLQLDPASEDVMFVTMKSPVWNFAVFQYNKMRADRADGACTRHVRLASKTPP